MRNRSFAVALSLTIAHTGAAVVKLNPDPTGLSISPDVMDARYRLSNNNWDQMISISSNVSGSTIVQQSNLGTHNNLNARQWDFDLGYNPVNGWSWTLTPVTGTGGGSLFWSAPFNGTSPFRSFNGLELFAVAANLDPAAIATGTSSATNITFTAPGQTVTGGLTDLVTTWTGANTGGLVRQFIVSDSDMSTFAWNIRGRFELAFTYKPGISTTGNLDERLKFDIKAGTIIPAPSAAALIAGAGLLALRRRRTA